MKATIIRETASGVVLELSLDEYKVLNGLRYSHLGGSHPVRSALEHAFAEADQALGFGPDYRRLSGSERSSSLPTVERMLKLSDPQVKARDF